MFGRRGGCLRLALAFLPIGIVIPLRAFRGLAFLAAFGHIRFFRFAFARLAKLLVLLLGALRLGLLAVAVVLVVLFLALLGGALHQLQGNQNIARQLCEGGLIVNGPFQAFQQRAGLILDPGAPNLDNSVGAARRLLPGELLARDQRQCLVDWGLLAVDVALGQPFVSAREFRGEVLGHAAHAQRANRLDPRPLGRVERLPRGAFRRGQGRMQFGVVHGDHEGNGIRIAADDRGLLARHGAAWQRQPGSLAVEAGHVGAEYDVHRLVSGKRPRRERYRALERRQRVRPFLRAICHRRRPLSLKDEA